MSLLFHERDVCRETDKYNRSCDASQNKKIEIVTTAFPAQNEGITEINVVEQISIQKATVFMLKP